jgi:hypothetical protein
MSKSCGGDGHGGKLVVDAVGVNIVAGDEDATAGDGEDFLERHGKKFMISDL